MPQRAAESYQRVPVESSGIWSHLVARDLARHEHGRSWTKISQPRAQFVTMRTSLGSAPERGEWFALTANCVERVKVRLDSYVLSRLPRRGAGDPADQAIDQ
jgi:hypothetical protein